MTSIQIVLNDEFVGVIDPGERYYHVTTDLRTKRDYSVSIMGWRLDRYDLAIWCECHRIAAAELDGTSLIRFSIPSFLRGLGRVEGISIEDVDDFTDRLKSLSQTVTRFEDSRAIGYPGAFLLSFAIDRKELEAVVELNPSVKPTTRSAKFSAALAQPLSLPVEKRHTELPFLGEARAN